MRPATAVRPFVVTGCGRSGTMYTALLLRELGLACGHEAVFHPALTRFQGFGEVDGDASWLAVPFIASLPPETVVLHQVRDPLAVCASFTAMSFFGPVGFRLRRPADRRFVGFLRHHQPEAFTAKDARSGAAAHWVGWNQRVEDSAGCRGLAYERYRIEDMTSDGWSRLLLGLGVDRDPADVRAALERVPLTTNRRRAPQPFEASGLGGSLRASLTRLAAAYGYSLP